MKSSLPITLRRAVVADTALLADLRIEFLLDLFGKPTDAEIATLREALLGYYAAATASRECISFFAVAGNAVVGSGSVVMRQQAGGFKNPSGRIGYIMNIYTQPAYRRQGIAARIMEALLEAGKAQGIKLFDLHASESGAPVYERIGFEKTPQPSYRLLVP